ncbi:hypothetical protein ACFQS1_11765 [Paractinoplanes rhizophilus]|uniref:Uncharacterized protein n=1 Tax=Paractinoplanes rhizophilus TaxID=1416877 RepID=A0ABW2HSD6_9ACTN
MSGLPRSALFSVAVIDSAGPDLETGALVGAALLGTALTVLACARLSAAEPG